MQSYYLLFGLEMKLPTKVHPPPPHKVPFHPQEKAYETQNFIAEFGGTVDLFIGFSFFTVFQLFEIVVAACVYKLCNRNKTVQSHVGTEQSHVGTKCVVVRNGGLEDSVSSDDVRIEDMMSVTRNL